MKATDIRPVAAQLYLLPLRTRMPLRFGAETLTSLTCARVCLVVEDRQGRRACGWGETPLSVQWVWPSASSYDERYQELVALCADLATAWAGFACYGHPLEVGHAFQALELPRLLREHNQQRGADLEAIPWLAALVCCSAYDIALHDAFGNLLNLPIYATYSADYLNNDLTAYLTPAERSDVTFKGRYPQDLLANAPGQLPVWHVVGGSDPVDESELTGREPNDGFPVLLHDWINQDGLRCLKVKLHGDDAVWDYARFVKVGLLAERCGVLWLSADFNCTVHDPAYVVAILERLLREYPRLYGMLLYVEQPFPYDLETYPLDVHAVSAYKPLFMDESAHDWRLVKLGRELGWSGVALKSCKTQTGALLTCCWARAHGMPTMVQDLTNPMLAQIPHVLLAAHAGTIMGVESNSMQFYPEASRPEAAVHPGLYRRRAGILDLSTIRGSGFGYRLGEIQRDLPPALVEAGDCSF